MAHRREQMRIGREMSQPVVVIIEQPCHCNGDIAIQLKVAGEIRARVAFRVELGKDLIILVELAQVGINSIVRHAAKTCAKCASLILQRP